MQGVVVFGSVYVKTWVEGEWNELVRGMGARRVFRVVGHGEYGLPRVGEDGLAVETWRG